MIALAPRDLALLVAISLVWGLNLVISKYGIEHLPPVYFSLLRFSIVALVLAPFLRFRVGEMSPLIIAAVLSGGLHIALLFIGLSHAANVSSVAIATQLGIPFTTLLSVALLGEVVRWRRWTGILLAFAGVGVMGFDPQVAERWGSLALVVGAAFASSLGLIAMKRVIGFRAIEMSAWVAWTSVPVLLGLTLTLERQDIPAPSAVPLGAWGAVLFAALVSSVLAQVSFYRLIQRYPVTSVAPITLLSPLFSIAFGMLLLDDRLTTRIALGAALTLIGVLIITLRERRITDTGT
jgi:O-acetylserine/cysteine efflux transporter